MILKSMSCRKKFLDRFAMMISDEQINRLKSARIILFGVGGVGGALAHMLVRSGITYLAIVDFDTIDETNINRQLIAYQNNVGKYKVDELELQLKNINSELDLIKHNFKLDEISIHSIDFTKYDIILDCIDDINAKKLLIKLASNEDIYILSAMGAGNRYSDIPYFEISDISKTSYDPIAKILRKYCNENKIKKLDVCYTKQKAMKFDCKTIGSVVYYPVNMATVMCARIINKIIG